MAMDIRRNADRHDAVVGFFTTLLNEKYPVTPQAEQTVDQRTEQAAAAAISPVPPISLDLSDRRLVSLDWALLAYVGRKWYKASNALAAATVFENNMFGPYQHDLEPFLGAHLERQDLANLLAREIEVLKVNNTKARNLTISVLLTLAATVAAFVAKLYVILWIPNVALVVGVGSIAFGVGSVVWYWNDPKPIKPKLLEKARAALGKLNEDKTAIIEYLEKRKPVVYVEPQHHPAEPPPAHDLRPAPAYSEKDGSADCKTPEEVVADRAAAARRRAGGSGCLSS